MKKHFRVFSIVFTSLLAIFINGCEEPMDTVVETVVNPPTQPSTEPIAPVNYRGYAFNGTLDHQESIYAVAFEPGINFDSPDRTLASLGAESLKVWDPYTSQLKETIPLDAWPEIGVVSPRIIELKWLGGDWYGGELDDLDFPAVPRHTSPVRSIASDGLLLASGSSDGTVHVWEREYVEGHYQHIPLYTLSHEGQVWAVAFSPDGATLASGGGFEGIHLWDARTGQSMGPPLIASTAQVESIAFGPGPPFGDGNLLFVATGRGDGEAIHVWDLRTNQLIDTLRADGYTVRKVAVSRDGQLVAGGAFYPDGPGVLLWKQK